MQRHSRILLYDGSLAKPPVKKDFMNLLCNIAYETNAILYRRLSIYLEFGQLLFIDTS